MGWYAGWKVGFLGSLGWSGAREVLSLRPPFVQSRTLQNDRAGAGRSSALRSFFVGSASGAGLAAGTCRDIDLNLPAGILYRGRPRKSEKILREQNMD